MTGSNGLLHTLVKPENCCMKRSLLLSAKTALSLALLFLLSGCLKDECANTLTIYTPVYKTLTEVRAGMKSGPPQPLKNTGKIYVQGRYIYLNEIGKGIHVINNSNPATPQNTSFITIPGNVDLAVKGTTLYADSYSDLAVFNLSTPTNVTAPRFVNNVFPDRGGYYWYNSTNPDSIRVLVDYVAKDTTVDCNTYRSWNNCGNCAIQNADGSRFYTAASAPTGIGGSMARFTIVKKYLYTVTNQELFSFDINNASDPQLKNRQQLGNWNIETIYPFQDKLFIGSRSGMFIYDVANASNPSPLGQFSHVRSCDPVIADERNAYVTLRSGTQCEGFTNQLEVLNIENLAQPSLVKTYSLTNPHGLSKDGHLLFICDGADGLKIYDATDATRLQLIKTIPGLETYDVILQDKIALVVAKDGLYQFDYSDINNIRQISKISITK